MIDRYVDQIFEAATKNEVSAIIFITFIVLNMILAFAKNRSIIFWGITGFFFSFLSTLILLFQSKIYKVKKN